MIQHMWDEEKAHLAKFEALIPEQRVRPSLLVPFWSAAGYALGAGGFYSGSQCCISQFVVVLQLSLQSRWLNYKLIKKCLVY